MVTHQPNSRPSLRRPSAALRTVRRCDSPAIGTSLHAVLAPALARSFNFSRARRRNHAAPPHLGAPLRTEVDSREPPLSWLLQHRDFGPDIGRFEGADSGESPAIGFRRRLLLPLSLATAPRGGEKRAAARSEQWREAKACNRSSR